MKEIGVVRKIDELGRVVIPKEIRKTLGIKDGENLEIFIEKNNICLKKYSTLYSLNKWAQFVVDVCKNELNLNLIVLDMNQVIASYHETLMGRGYPKIIDNHLNSREKYFSLASEEIFSGFSGYYYFLPLILNGELLGSVVLFSSCEVSEFLQKLLEFISKILVYDIG